MESESVKRGTSAAAEALPEDLYGAGLRATVVGIVLNTLLIALKLAGGILGASAAVIADAAHSFSDVITDIGVFISLKYISKPADTTHAYGHGRVETGISFLMGLAIVFTGLGIMKSGAYTVVEALHGVCLQKPGGIALFVGFASILSKEALFHYTRAVAKKSGSRALEANAWHHRSDALSSVGTVIGVGGAYFLGERWTVLDPAAAVVISVLVIKVGMSIGWSAFKELTDASLSEHARERVEKAISGVGGVEGAHKIRTRSLGRYVTVDAHVLVDPAISVKEGHDIATRVESAVRESLGNAAFVTIHIEPKEK